MTDDLERTPPPATQVLQAADRAMRAELARVQRWDRRRRRVRQVGGWLVAAVVLVAGMALGMALRR